MDAVAIGLFIAFTAALCSCVYQVAYHRGYRDGRLIEDYRELLEKQYHDE